MTKKDYIPALLAYLVELHATTDSDTIKRLAKSLHLAIIYKK